jgi:hypothetical protein
MGGLAAATQSGVVRPPRASWCRLRNFRVLLLAVCELENAAAAAAAQWRLDNDDCSDGDDDHTNHVSMVVAATEVILCAVDSYLSHFGWWNFSGFERARKLVLILSKRPRVAAATAIPSWEASSRRAVTYLYHSLPGGPMPEQEQS